MCSCVPSVASVSLRRRATVSLKPITVYQHVKDHRQSPFPFVDDAKVRIYLSEYQVFKRFLPTISSRKQSGEIRQNYSLQRTLAKGRKWSEENSLSHQHQQNIPS